MATIVWLAPIPIPSDSARVVSARVRASLSRPVHARTSMSVSPDRGNRLSVAALDFVGLLAVRVGTAETPRPQLGRRTASKRELKPAERTLCPADRGESMNDGLVSVLVPQSPSGEAPQHRPAQGISHRHVLASKRIDRSAKERDGGRVVGGQAGGHRGEQFVDDRDSIRCRIEVVGRLSCDVAPRDALPAGQAGGLECLQHRQAARRRVERPRRERRLEEDRRGDGCLSSQQP